MNRTGPSVASLTIRVGLSVAGPIAGAVSTFVRCGAKGCTAGLALSADPENAGSWFKNSGVVWLPPCWLPSPAAVTESSLSCCWADASCLDGGPNKEVCCCSVLPEADSDSNSMGIEETCCDCAEGPTCVGGLGLAEVGMSVVGTGISAEAMMNSSKIPGARILGSKVNGMGKGEYCVVNGIRRNCVTLVLPDATSDVPRHRNRPAAEVICAMVVGE